MSKNVECCHKFSYTNNCIGQINIFTFAKINIEKNVKERVHFKNYKERFERLLHL